MRGCGRSIYNIVRFTWSVEETDQRGRTRRTTEARAGLPGSAEVRGADRASQIRGKLLRNGRGRDAGVVQARDLSESSGGRQLRHRNQLHGADRGMGEEEADK